MDDITPKAEIGSRAFRVVWEVSLGTEMVVTRYKNSGKHLGLQLALVTDLHNCDHTTLIQLLREEQPDAILCAGDILERHEYGMSEWTTHIIEKWMFSIGKPKLSERIMWGLDQLVEGVGSISDSQEDTAILFCNRQVI